MLVEAASRRSSFLKNSLRRIAAGLTVFIVAIGLSACSSIDVEAMSSGEHVVNLTDSSWAGPKWVYVDLYGVETELSEDCSSHLSLNCVQSEDGEIVLKYSTYKGNFYSPQLIVGDRLETLDCLSTDFTRHICA